MPKLIRRFGRVAMLGGVTTLALTLGASSALSTPLAPCTLAVKSGDGTAFRSGLFSGACVKPSVRIGVDEVRAGAGAGRLATFSLLEGDDCGGRTLAQGHGVAYFVPPINFATIRIDHCP